MYIMVSALQTFLKRKKEKQTNKGTDIFCWWVSPRQSCFIPGLSSPGWLDRGRALTQHIANPQTGPVASRDQLNRETLPLGHLNWEMGRESGRDQALKQERYHDLALDQEWSEEAEMMRKKNLQHRKETRSWRSQGSYAEPVSVEGNRREGVRDQGQCRGREEKSGTTLRRESGHATSSTEVLKDRSYKVWSRQDSLTISSTLN